jgi:NAD+ synthase
MNEKLNQIDQLLQIDPAATRAALTQFIRDGLARAGYDRAVIGLSGGIDSALSCTLTVDALGAENVLALWMPYRTSNPDNLQDARKVVDQLGVAFETVEITPMVAPYFERMPGITPVRMGNVMARTRMIVLYDHSEVWNGLVIGTGNKTETWLGYGTLFGDMACALNPIGDLYKTQVRQLSRALGVPDSIIAKPPSADLWVGQTDEGELGFAYADIDRALYLLVDRQYTVEEAIAYGLPASLVEGASKRMQWSQFKRELPPVAQIPD